MLRDPVRVGSGSGVCMRQDAPEIGVAVGVWFMLDPVCWGCFAQDSLVLKARFWFDPNVAHSLVCIRFVLDPYAALHLDPCNRVFSARKLPLHV